MIAFICQFIKVAKIVLSILTCPHLLSGIFLWRDYSLCQLSGYSSGSDLIGKVGYMLDGFSSFWLVVYKNNEVVPGIL